WRKGVHIQHTRLRNSSCPPASVAVSDAKSKHLHPANPILRPKINKMRGFLSLLQIQFGEMGDFSLMKPLRRTHAAGFVRIQSLRGIQREFAAGVPASGNGTCSPDSAIIPHMPGPGAAGRKAEEDRIDFSRIQSSCVARGGRASGGPNGPDGTSDATGPSAGGRCSAATERATAADRPATIGCRGIGATGAGDRGARQNSARLSGPEDADYFWRILLDHGQWFRPEPGGRLPIRALSGRA